MKENDQSEKNKIKPIPAFPNEGKEVKRIALLILVLVFVVLFLTTIL